MPPKKTHLVAFAVFILAPFLLLAEEGRSCGQLRAELQADCSTTGSQRLPVASSTFAQIRTNNICCPGSGALPEVEAHSGVTLQQLQELAAQNNPTLLEAEQDIRAAAGRARQAGAYPNPVVGYDADEVSGGPLINGGQHGFFIEQDIILGGKLGLARRVLAGAHKTAELQAEGQRLRVNNGITQYFFKALAAQRQVELATRFVDITAEAANTAKQLFNVGQADHPDVLQSEVEVEQAKLALGAAQRNQRRIWTELAASIGKPGLPFTHLDGDLEEVATIDPEQWLGTLLTQSPAVKIASVNIEQAQAVLNRANREPIPNISIRGGARNNRELTGLAGHAIGWQAFAEIGVRVPLFDRNQGAIAAATADVERAKQEQRRIELSVRQRSAALFQQYLASYDAVQGYRSQILPRAQQAYRLYLEKYNAMSAAYPQVLVSQRTLFELQRDYIDALETLWITVIGIRGYLLSGPLEPPTRVGIEGEETRAPGRVH